MIENPNTGFTKLFHPRGPQVTLPVPAADPKAAFQYIGQCLDAGWLVTAPGLEEGEQKEEVGYVLRGKNKNDDGTTTPFLLLYSTNEAHSFSFLKVYLNTPGDIGDFEYASKMKLARLPEYDGRDKPERGKEDKVIQAPRPFTVIFKANPKYSEADRAAHQQRNAVYKVPVRLFVRWADQAPQSSIPSESTPPAAPVPTSAPATRPAMPAPARPSTTTTPTRPAAQTPPTLDAQNAQVLRDMVQAATKADLDAVRARANKVAFREDHFTEQDAAYEDRLLELERHGTRRQMARA